MAYSLIACDYDLTLTRSDRKVSPHTRDTIRAVFDAGKYVTLASGRLGESAEVASRSFPPMCRSFSETARRCKAPRPAKCLPRRPWTPKMRSRFCAGAAGEGAPPLFTPAAASTPTASILRRRSTPSARPARRGAWNRRRTWHETAFIRFCCSVLPHGTAQVGHIGDSRLTSASTREIRSLIVSLLKFTLVIVVKSASSTSLSVLSLRRCSFSLAARARLMSSPVSLS